MLHEKSLLSYLLAVVAMATVGCDDDTVNHDVFTKADGTLNMPRHRTKDLQKRQLRRFQMLAKMGYSLGCECLL